MKYFSSVIPSSNIHQHSTSFQDTCYHMFVYDCLCLLNGWLQPWHGGVLRHDWTDWVFDQQKWKTFRSFCDWAHSLRDDQTQNLPIKRSGYVRLLQRDQGFLPFCKRWRSGQPICKCVSKLAFRARRYYRFRDIQAQMHSKAMPGTSWHRMITWMMWETDGKMKKMEKSNWIWRHDAFVKRHGAHCILMHFV